MRGLILVLRRKSRIEICTRRGCSREVYVLLRNEIFCWHGSCKKLFRPEIGPATQAGVTGCRSVGGIKPQSVRRRLLLRSLTIRPPSIAQLMPYRVR